MTRQQHSRRPMFETLENRALLCADFAPVELAFEPVVEHSVELRDVFEEVKFDEVSDAINVSAEALGESQRAESPAVALSPEIKLAIEQILQDSNGLILPDADLPQVGASDVAGEPRDNGMPENAADARTLMTLNDIALLDLPELVLPEPPIVLIGDLAGVQRGNANPNPVPPRQLIDLPQVGGNQLNNQIGDKAPVNPAPVNPAPVNPAPVNPAPVNPVAVKALVKPAPVKPAPFVSPTNKLGPIFNGTQVAAINWFNTWGGADRSFTQLINMRNSLTQSLAGATGSAADLIRAKRARVAMEIIRDQFFGTNDLAGVAAAFLLADRLGYISLQWTNDSNFALANSADALLMNHQMSCFEFVHLCGWLAGTQPIFSNSTTPANNAADSAVFMGGTRNASTSAGSSPSRGAVVIQVAPFGNNSGGYYHVGISIGNGFMISLGGQSNLHVSHTSTLTTSEYVGLYPIR